MVVGVTTRENVLQGILFLGMGICFSFQILDTFEKYLAKKTSISVSSELKTSDEPLPTFSICTDPPFDVGMLANGFGVAPNIFYPTGVFGSGSFPENLTLNQLWKLVTVKPYAIYVGSEEEIVQGVISPENRTEIDSFQTFNSLWYGECTTIVLKKPKRAQSDELTILIVYAK